MNNVGELEPLPTMSSLRESWLHLEGGATLSMMLKLAKCFGEFRYKSESSQGLVYGNISDTNGQNDAP